jgi:hypothetical protein
MTMLGDTAWTGRDADEANTTKARTTANMKKTSDRTLTKSSLTSGIEFWLTA